MTYCILDTTPDDWHKVNFSSAYLHQVERFFAENEGINGRISGAISFGIMGPAPSLVSFEKQDDHDQFVEWFADNQNDPLDGCIYICLKASIDMMQDKA